MPADDDLRWRITAGTFRFLVPGYGALARRSGGTDGLQLMRELWVTFVGALILFGVVVVFAASGSTASDVTWWIVGLVALSLVGLVAQEVLGLRGCGLSLVDALRTPPGGSSDSAT